MVRVGQCKVLHGFLTINPPVVIRRGVRSPLFFAILFEGVAGVDRQRQVILVRGSSILSVANRLQKIIRQNKLEHDFGLVERV
jgi:hypothetical protein